MSNRKQYAGKVKLTRRCFYGNLEAEFTGDNGVSLYWYTAPRAFENLYFAQDHERVTEPSNVLAVKFTANEDGSNPRGVRFISG